ncbi:uncharacterized protein LOC122374629 isoform X2 [Amphibalanus amphitrite]|uniref:uncharacterized protein LOC122374629 isoform X2 n=1 Tax=Amphibalanus amphitrite TaxID=1232801 RepID=UPI001C927730|nr:uncharacterized protein LOC122374629 isoform X2 [Amphibalanus amphitrite]
MAAGRVCLLLTAAVIVTLCPPAAGARKAMLSRTTKRGIKGHSHDSHDIRRTHKYVMMVVRGRAPPRPRLPALFISEFGQSYSDYDSHAPRDRPTRLARLDNSVVAERETDHDELRYR